MTDAVLDSIDIPDWVPEGDEDEYLAMVAAHCDDGPGEAVPIESLPGWGEATSE